MGKHAPTTVGLMPTATLALIYESWDADYQGYIGSRKHGMVRRGSLVMGKQPAKVVFLDGSLRHRPVRLNGR